MNSVRSNSLSLKYPRITLLGWKDIEVWIFEFVAKTQFLREIFDKPTRSNLMNGADMQMTFQSLISNFYLKD